DYANGLAGTLVNLANEKTSAADFAAAKDLLEKARPYHQAALAVSPQDPTYRQFFRNNPLAMGQALANLGDHRGLASEAEELVRFGFDPVNDTYDAAVFLAFCAALAERDAKLDQAGRKEQGQRYADRGMELLRQAVSKGFRNADRMKTDRNLNSLH